MRVQDGESGSIWLEVLVNCVLFARDGVRIAAVAPLVVSVYRGHDAENPRRVFIFGQKRGIFGIIKRELRRRSAIEPVIGHLKAKGHLGRCYLKGRAGEAANAILSAIGYNFRRILAWLRALLRLFMIAILRLLISRSPLIPAS
jgi:IS5 family transposase